MESAFISEHNTLINGLVQGMKKAKQLQFYMCSSSSLSEAQNLLLKRILSSYEKALLILKWKGAVGQTQATATLPESGAPESSISVDGSFRSEDLNNNLRDHQDYSSSKKRSCCRCTYRLVQNCWATKQVQRSDDDPTIFEITYKGTHTCNLSTNAVLLPPSPEKQLKHNLMNHQPQPQNLALLNLKANLRLNTENLDNKETPAQFSFQSTYACRDRENQYFPVSDLVGDGHLASYSPLFLSPATSETTYFSPTTHHMNNFGGTCSYQHSESDIAEIIQPMHQQPILQLEAWISRLNL